MMSDQSIKRRNVSKGSKYCINQSERFVYIQTSSGTYVHIKELGLIKSIERIDLRKMIRDGVFFYDYTADRGEIPHFSKSLIAWDGFYYNQIRRYCNDQNLIVRDEKTIKGTYYIHLNIDLISKRDRALKLAEKIPVNCRICNKVTTADQMFKHYRSHWSDQYAYNDNIKNLAKYMTVGDSHKDHLGLCLEFLFDEGRKL